MNDTMSAPKNQAEELESTVEALLPEIVPDEQKPDQLAEGTPENRTIFREAMLFNLLVIGIWAGTLYIWMLAHDVQIFRFISPDKDFLKAVADFNFIGITDEKPNPSILSLNFEIMMFSFFGVVLSTLYNVNNAISHGKKFYIKLEIVKWLGDMMIAAGIAQAIILFLSITSFSIGTAEVTLANANYGTIAAIAFILGFYHDNARRLLNNLSKRLISSLSDSSKGGKDA